MDKEDKLRKEVVKAGKVLFKRGIVENNEGNVSVRVPRKKELMITPTANQ
ncbi:MAG: aldolase, partial [Candidatus Lokiarchaeota archaeon]|nr:aldolase [Candidatus Lokiarchaeota archaeon]